MRSTRSFQRQILRDPASVSPALADVLAIANTEKEALGFLPEAAYRDAIAQRRLFVIRIADSERIAGFVLWGGVFPHARVQQIGVASEFRRDRVGSTLLNCLVSDLERLGYLTLKAAIASDLTAALSFYQQNGFEPSYEKAGGSARRRSILVHVRQLNTPSLFSAFRVDEAQAPSAHFDFAGRGSATATPLYAIDLNVLFDLSKNRARSAEARKLFGAALSHNFRLAVAPEFIAELERTSDRRDADPIFQMALQLPRLPNPAKADLDGLADLIHQLVFVEAGLKSAGSPQSLSDARHLAHSALSRAAGYITSDKALLAARPRLLEKVGIDVASCEELLALLPKVDTNAWDAPRGGYGFVCSRPSPQAIRSYMVEQQISAKLIQEFVPEDRQSVRSLFWGISVGADLRAVAAISLAASIGAPARICVHVRPDNTDGEFFADYLLDNAIAAVSRSDPAAIELVDIPGQSPAKSVAAVRGFLGPRGRDLSKLAVGRPLTKRNWSATMEQIRRKTGITFPHDFPSGLSEDTMVVAKDANGALFRRSAAALERLFDPTVILWSGRGGVIVPIKRSFADELLGTSHQLELPIIEKRDASFKSQRVYVNTPRSASKMRPGVPILFYESGREGGRSAVVAIARIVDSLIARKQELPHESARGIVTDDLEQFSSTDDVLLTTFESLMQFPKPCPLSELRSFNATGTQNLLTVTEVSSANLAKIVSAGWSA